MIRVVGGPRDPPAWMKNVYCEVDICMKASIVDLRYRMKEVLRAIERGEPVTVLYRGKEKATIVPINAKKTKRDVADHPFWGMWKDREDMKDPADWVRRLRSQKRFPDLLP